MNLHERLRPKPTSFRQFTGLTVAEFDKLRDDLEPVLAARKAKAQTRRPRQRKPGAGRKSKLGSDDRLLLVLMYYRVYVTQVVLGGLFGVDAGTACRTIRAVGLALAGVFRIPERKVRVGADELAEAFVDATEQPTHRPARGPKRYDSGKKKRHTLKHQVVVVRKKKRPGRAGAGRGSGRCGSRRCRRRPRGPCTTRRCTTDPGWNSRPGCRAPGRRPIWGPGCGCRRGSRAAGP